MNNSVKFLLPLFALAFLLVSCKKSTTVTPPPPGSGPSSVATRVTFDGTMLTGKHTVVLKTSLGDITMELDADAAPKTVTNFVTLAKAGYYDGLTFHRVIPGFMVQGGDPQGNGTGGYSIFGDTFEDEINASSYGLDKTTLKQLAKGQQLPPDIENLTVQQFYEKQGYIFSKSLKSLPMARGSLAMANAGPGTNGSQFFIIQAEKTPWLEGKHTIFGKVTSGMEVVDAMTKVQRDSSDKPLTPITYTVEVK